MVLERVNDLLWFKFTDKGHLAVVASSCDINRDAIFVGGVKVPITANKHKKQIICLKILPIMWYTIL